MRTRLLSLLSSRLIVIVLLVGLCLTGTSLALFHYTRSFAATPAPYYTMVIDGQEYVAQYEGGAYNSDVTTRSVYSDFGKWDEYTVDSNGTWHWYGQFSGNENTYYDGHDKVQTGVNVEMPGVGHIDTYDHEEVLDPSLPAPPSGYTSDGENYLGVASAVRQTTGLPEDCEVDASNIDNARLGSGTRQLEFNLEGPQSTQDKDCLTAHTFLRTGDTDINNFYRRLSQSLSVTPDVNGPVMASLYHPLVLPVPVILGVAGGIFFIGGIVTGNICNFASCSNTAKKVLVGVALGMGIISGVLGISSGILTAMKAFAEAAPVLEGPAGGVINEVVGAAAAPGAVGDNVVASEAASEAASISSSSSFHSVESHL